MSCLHALLSAQLLSDVEQSKDTKDKNQAYQYLRVVLQNAIPLLHISTISVANEITQLKLSVSTLKDTVDIHKAKVTKHEKPIRDSSNTEDTVLTTQVEELQEGLTTL